MNYLQYNASEKGDKNCETFIDKVNLLIAGCSSLYRAPAVGNAWRRMRKSVLRPMPLGFKARQVLSFACGWFFLCGKFWLVDFLPVKWNYFC